MRNAYRVLARNLKGPLRRPRRRLENNIKMDLNEIGYDGMETKINQQNAQINSG